MRINQEQAGVQAPRTSAWTLALVFQCVLAAATVSVASAGDPPFGQVDTPLQNATDVVGAIGVTGWALDDVGVARVEIFRNCLWFENPANCQTVSGHRVVYIGDAAFLPGARADVEAGFPTYPQAYRAGWGYLMLTNMLPHVPRQEMYGGQGSILLYAFARDAEGQRTLLGRSWSGDHTPTTITMANDTIAKPFGVIDTPGQGQTVSGALANFGWVLTPDRDLAGGQADDILVPVDGSTMKVVIDGVPVGNVAYNQCRGTEVVGNPVHAGMFCNDDVANIFGNPTPQPSLQPRILNLSRFRNLDLERAAIGAFEIDTFSLASGMHTIAWGVIDSAGRTEGIGSRFFTVANGPAIALSGNLAFGYVPVGQSAVAALTIRNYGGGPLTVSGISLPPGFTGNWSGIIAAGGSQRVSVGFAPTSTGNYGGTLSVAANHVAGINMIGVSATGTTLFPVGSGPQDMAPGRYYADPALGCYWARHGSLGGTPIANDKVSFDSRQSIVDILPTDAAFETSAECGTWFTTARHGLQTTILPGTWLVGSQVGAGTYQATTGPGCYWERLRNFTGELGGIIANEFVDAGGVRQVSISASDAGFNTDGDCGEWSPVSTPAMSADMPRGRTARSGVEVERRRAVDRTDRFRAVSIRDGIELRGKGQLSVLTEAEKGPALARGDAIVLAVLPLATQAVPGRTGFDFDAPYRDIPADPAGTRHVQLEELGRLELRLEFVETGYLVANGTLRDLPPGSRLDVATGQFTWAPGPGYLGTYRLTFIRQGAQVRVDVTIRPRTKRSEFGSEIRMHVDLPEAGQNLAGQVRVAGWALDPQAWTGSGIDVVDVWAFRRDLMAAAPLYLGPAILAVERPDVAAAFGQQFSAAGFDLSGLVLDPGVYDVTAFARSWRTGRWEDARTVRITVR